MKSKGVRRDTFLLGGERYQHFVKSSQVLPARPSGWSSMKMKVYEEDVRMVAVVAWNKG